MSSFLFPLGFSAKVTPQREFHRNFLQWMEVYTKDIIDEVTKDQSDRLIQLKDSKAKEKIMSVY